MKHVASFDGKVNEQFSRLGSPRKLENRTTSAVYDKQMGFTDSHLVEELTE